MKKNKYSFAVLMSGVLWGIISLFIKSLSGAGLEPMQIVFLRMLVAAPTFLIYALIRRRSLKIDLKDIWMFIGIGVISEVIFNCFYFYTMIQSEASVAVVLLYTSPAFILILSAILFKERIKLRKLTALVLTLAGCVLVSGVIGSTHAIGAFVIFTGVCSGFFYSLYTIFSRYALKKYSTETTMVYSFAFALLSSLFIGKPVDSIKAVANEPILIFYALGIGVICTAMPCFLYTWGLRKIESGKAAVLGTVEPLVGSIIGMTVYNESKDPFKIIGIMLIIAAIVILEFTRLKLPKKLRKHIKSL